MKSRRVSSLIVGVALAVLVLAAAIGCEQEADGVEAPLSGLTLKGTEAGAAYAVRVYPSPEGEAVGSDTWTEATADEKLAAQGEATAEGAEVLVSLSAVPQDGSQFEGTGAFAGTGAFIVVVMIGEETRYAVIYFHDGNAAIDLANMKAPPENPDYGITLSQKGTLVFDAANEDYEAREPVTITVSNIGKDDTGKLTIGLAGDKAGAFTLNKKSISNIAVDEKATFTVVPAAGLYSGVYTATVSVTGEKIAAKSFAVSFSVNYADGTPPVEEPPPEESDPVYDIELSQKDTLTFPPANAGYGTPATSAVTVRNTGNRPTGALTLALSGDNGGSFTLSKSKINNIAVNGSDSFTVGPATGLAAGSYAATVTVSGEGMFPQSFDVSFTVMPAGLPIYAIELSRTKTLIFDEAIFDYAARTPQAITVRNIGNQETGELTVTLAGNNPSAFTLNKPAIDSIAVNGADSFTVVPNHGLAEGTYTATVSVTGDNGISAGFGVSFTVKPVSSYGIELSQTGPLVFADAIEGRTVPAAQAITVSNRGNQPTGELAIVVSSKDFMLNRQQIASIAVGGTADFAMRPNSGLAEGDYTATVTVSGSNGISAGFAVSFKVNPAPEYGISVSVASGEFAKKGEGYAAIAPLAITVTNVGNRATVALTAALADEASDTAGITGAGAFVLMNAAIGAIPAGGQAVFGAGPRTGLLADAGGITVYTARVVISDTGVGGGTDESAVSESVDLKFTVAKNRIVSFNVNGGSPQPVTQIVTHGELASEPAANIVKKTNLRFKHWYADGQTAAFDFAAPITANTQINALWEATVTFVLNGGTGTAATQAVADGGFATAPAESGVSKTGLRLRGWYRNTTDTAAFDFTTPVTEHLVLNAVWEAAVTFNLNGGTGALLPQAVAEGGKAAEPPEPVWSGYTFGGWFADAEGTTKWEFGTDTVSAHRVLYAKWTVILRTVTFDSKGGSMVGAISGILRGTTIGEPAAPTKANLRFKHWYADGQTAAFDFAAPITEDTQVNALWEADVTFILHGGTGTVAEQVVAEGGVATAPAEDSVSKAGLRLRGWYRNVTDAAAFNFAAPITGHTELHAVWVADLTFNLNGATGTAPATQAVKEGAKATAPANPSQGADWEFDGWYTEAAGTTKWDFAANTVSAHRTLYAKRTRLWSVTLNRNGGTGGQNVYKVRNGAVFTPPALTPPATYAFAGWFREAAFTNAVTTVTVTADTPLYAKWTATGATLFNVTLNLNGGFWDAVLDASVPKSYKVSSGTIVNVSASENPRRVGYEFRGWYYDSALTQAVPKTLSNTVSGFSLRYAVTVSGNRTLYAKWEQRGNVKVTLKSGVMRWCDGGAQEKYEYSVPYGARVLDVNISTIKDGKIMQAINISRVALKFPSVNENRLQYYEYGLSGDRRFYWGDRFYSDTILWGKYKWRAGGLVASPPEPGWDEDYPGVPAPTKATL